MTTTYLFKNNAISTLSGPISNTAATINMASGSGVLFPSPSGSQVFTLTLVSAANSTLREIVYCTNVSGDALTVVRAQEGTTALSFLAGDIADHRLTAGALQSLVQSGNGFYFGTDTGSANALSVSVAGVSSLAAGQLYIVKKSPAGNTGPATLSINSLIGITVTAADGTGLGYNDWPGGMTGIVEFDGTRFNLLSSVGPSGVQRPPRSVAFTPGVTYWTVPDGVIRIRACVWGAGGSGAGGSVAGAAGSGGGGGGYAEGYYSVTPEAVIPITVGATGAIVSGAVNGNGGGISSVGTLLSATGGGGGYYSGGGAQPTVGSAGMGYGGTLFNISGQSGGASFIVGTTALCGFGGSSYGGAGGPGGIPQVGGDGGTPGGGGAGSAYGYASAAGAAGQVILNY